MYIIILWLPGLRVFKIFLLNDNERKGIGGNTYSFFEVYNLLRIIYWKNWTNEENSARI